MESIASSVQDPLVSTVGKNKFFEARLTLCYFGCEDQHFLGELYPPILLRQHIKSLLEDDGSCGGSRILLLWCCAKFLTITKHAALSLSVSTDISSASFLFLFSVVLFSAGIESDGLVDVLVDFARSIHCIRSACGCGSTCGLCRHRLVSGPLLSSFSIYIYIHAR